jgi:hypothetical protein
MSNRLIYPNLLTHLLNQSLVYIPDGFDMTYMKSKEGQDLIYKTFCLVCDWLTLDEKAQVNGVVFVSDYTGASLDFIKYWNAELEKKLLAYLQVNVGFP